MAVFFTGNHPTTFPVTAGEHKLSGNWLVNTQFSGNWLVALQQTSGTVMVIREYFVKVMAKLFFMVIYIPYFYNYNNLFICGICQK